MLTKHSGGKRRVNTRDRNRKLTREEANLSSLLLSFTDDYLFQLGTKTKQNKSGKPTTLDNQNIMEKRGRFIQKYKYSQIKSDGIVFTPSVHVVQLLKNFNFEDKQYLLNNINVRDNVSPVISGGSFCL